MGELERLEPHAPWEQRAYESDQQYAWFQEHADTLGERDLAKTARRRGVAVKLVREAAASHDWNARIEAFDVARAEIMKHIAPDDSEALSMQFAIGKAMIDLGIKAVQLKNPSLLRIADIQKLLQTGSEMMRRGAGVADLTIEQRGVQERIADEVGTLFGDD